MTTNNNCLNYKLHEFLGDEQERQKLEGLYCEFFNRSQPLDFRFKTFSDKQNKYKQHFEYLINQTKILFVSKEERVLGFICFDIEQKTLEIPDAAKSFLSGTNVCEFVFAASRDSHKEPVAKAGLDMFLLIKEKYNVKYIAGNVRRKRKKQQFIRACKTFFHFQFIGDFAYYEIP